MIQMKQYQDVIEILEKISSPNISDAMAKGLSRKFKHQTMDAGIKPLCTSFRVCGPAYTVCCYPGATYAMEKAIAKAPAGSVIVCDGKGSQAGVLLGELMSTLAQRRGVKGVIADGSVRDIDDILEMGFPVFARHVVACSGTFDQLGEVEIPISCGGILVRPGDIISADCNGVVVIPSEISSQVATAARELAAWEDTVKHRIIAGDTLEQAANACEKPVIQNV